MTTEEKILPDWFTHDSNGCIGSIKNSILYYLEKKKDGKEPDDERLIAAIAECDALHYLNTVLYLQTGMQVSLTGHLQDFGKYRSFPKVEIVKSDFDIKVNNRNSLRYLIGIFSELCRNAYKAKASKVLITITSDKTITISNNGAPITEEVKSKIFDKGFSTFGTTGMGLGYIQHLAEYANYDIELTGTDPVRFTLTFKDK